MPVVSCADTYKAAHSSGTYVCHVTGVIPACAPWHNHRWERRGRRKQNNPRTQLPGQSGTHQESSSTSASQLVGFGPRLTWAASDMYTGGTCQAGHGARRRSQRTRTRKCCTTWITQRVFIQVRGGLSVRVGIRSASSASASACDAANGICPHSEKERRVT